MNRFYYFLMLLAAVFSFASCSDDDGGGSSGGGRNANRNIVTDEPAVARLEFPRLKEGNNKVIVYRTNDSRVYDADRVNFAVEWDCDKKSQRWTCYQMHQGYRGTYSRVIDGMYPFDLTNLESDDYWDEDYIWNSGFQHGHICPSYDRRFSYTANYQTFYMTNMQPQYGNFNGSTSNQSLWFRLEGQVRDWVPVSVSDTLYVCKGGTIDDEDQILTRIQNRMIVPKYFFVALLRKVSSNYQAIGFYLEHTNQSTASENLADYAVSIDELEDLTGIDFFCNLPDETENHVEQRAYLVDWGLD